MLVVAMRTKNSLKNVFSSIFSNILNIVFGLIAQMIFIKELGSEYLGLNGLFNNIISMLGIAELGIGSAIVYNLYKPIAENNEKLIVQLMSFYKKCYHTIFLVVLTLGLALFPLLKYIIDFSSVTIDVNIYIIYFLFLFDSCMSYLMSYKRSILYANQKNYIINVIHMLYLAIMNTFQIMFLMLFKNYYLYLLIKLIMRLLENILITIVSNKLYPFLVNSKIKDKLEKNVVDDIITKVKGSFFHKIGSFVIFGTDNIIISKYLGLVTVGLYSNYTLIINSVQSVFSQVISSTTASIGNLLVTESTEKYFDVFKKIRFINFWIASFSSTSILVIMDSFIAFWIGKNYILPTSILIVLVIIYYFNLSRSTYSVFKDAAGIQYEDRYIPIFESVLNIFFSIFLVKRIGLIGVFLGTVISGTVIWLYSFPKYIYKKIFKRNYTQYIVETLGYFCTFIIIAFITLLLSKIVIVKNILLSLLINMLICSIVPNLIIIIFYFKSENFRYCLNFLKKISKLKN